MKREVTDLISIKRQILSIILAWLIFIGIDFLFHASLFASFWNENLAALKSLDDLAVLIPAGYLSFFFLTSLIGYVFFKIFKTKPEAGKVIQFGLIIALLYSLSNFLGLFSYIDLPVKQLIVFNLVYFIEVLIVCFFLSYVAFSKSLKKPIIFTTLVFFLLVIAGIAIQNVLSVY